jgi:hypothetical protein
LSSSLLGSIATGIHPSIFLQYGFAIRPVILGLLFGSIISYFFFSRETISATRTLVQEERIKRLTSEKKAVESNLRLLQAQIVQNKGRHNHYWSGNGDDTGLYEHL